MCRDVWKALIVQTAGPTGDIRANTDEPAAKVDDVRVASKSGTIGRANCFNGAWEPSVFDLLTQMTKA